MGDERVAETWEVGMRLKREEREIYLPLACPVELLRTIGLCARILTGAELYKTLVGGIR